MSRYDILLTNQPVASPPAVGLVAADPQSPPPSAEPAPDSQTAVGELGTQRAVSERSDQPTGRPVDRPTRTTSSGIVPRPKAFYITLRLDARLDYAVRYLQDIRGIKKADRSAIVNALLDRDELWTESALDDLADEVIDRLSRRLTR